QYEVWCKICREEVYFLIEISIKSEMYFLKKITSKEELTEAIESYINFYYTERFQLKLKGMAPM
ncbi:MAG: IS3 family transposase, partial [Acutalibacteraceae bacterium]|nr:IS3 family transposase [Acutalibacteraceae bacterium]